ncbi:hypothetical protein EIKCOROL_01073 [Eikenella corrodens ATCC 23834]|uniref:Uncharacterized protein n=1 Tax=Eikenella corrodens ATCC 23834 TaxID=546274 RepID=C0DUN7_EIKCO|nr:hypothetical protein EIKCOROL_01073 [Eikenella corrodens ATCC 23834]
MVVRLEMGNRLHNLAKGYLNIPAAMQPDISGNLWDKQVDELLLLQFILLRLPESPWA